jgi:hypothetical protein
MAELESESINLTGDGAKIELRITYPPSPTLDEAGMIWLESQCSFAAGPMNGRFRLSLTQLDLESFKRALERLIKGSVGVEASLKTIEEDIVLRCSVTKRGLTKVTSCINPRDASNVVCTFVFEAAPSDLEVALLGVTTVLHRIMQQ